MLKFLRAVSKQLWKNSKLYSRWNAGRSSEIFDIEVDSRKCFLINALIAFDLVYFYSWNIVVYFIIYIYILLKNKINLKTTHLNYASCYWNEFLLIYFIHIYIYIQISIKKFSNRYSFSLCNRHSVIYRVIETRTWYILSMEEKHAI